MKAIFPFLVAVSHQSMQGASDVQRTLVMKLAQHRSFTLTLSCQVHLTATKQQSE